MRNTLNALSASILLYICFVQVLGKMKDEYDGRPIAEFVGLRAKMYSVKEASGAERKKAKGIAKRTTESMVHDCYCWRHCMKRRVLLL
jgi:hypothetical protein